MHIIKAIGNLVMIGMYKKINIWKKNTRFVLYCNKYTQIYSNGNFCRSQTLLKLILKNTLLLYYCCDLINSKRIETQKIHNNSISV